MLQRSLESAQFLQDAPPVVCPSAFDDPTCAPSHAQPKPLDALPVPRYDDWFEQLDTVGPRIDRTKLLIPIETSRGCWYGQKHHCTFCGLNGLDIAIRSKSADRVLEELSGLREYGVQSVHAVDNILDSRYFRTVLPVLAAQDHGLFLFYEIKSKLTRGRVKLLAAAGVRAVQPGIESLSSDVLNLMNKGVGAYHNIRLLKWCAEDRIAVYWNVLYGFPTESAVWYEEMLSLMPLLSHLTPPSLGRVRLDRFSPLFEDGERLGVNGRRPSEAYDLIYEQDASAMNDLAYYFDFDHDGRQPYEAYETTLKTAVSRWQIDHEESILVGVDRPDGFMVCDTRPVAIESERLLTDAERKVLLACDGGLKPTELAERLSAHGALPDLVIQNLIHLGWLIEIDDRLLSLVVDVSAVVPPNVPPSILGSVAHAIGRARRMGPSMSETASSPPVREFA